MEVMSAKYMTVSALDGTVFELPLGVSTDRTAEVPYGPEPSAAVQHFSSAPGLDQLQFPEYSQAAPESGEESPVYPISVHTTGFAAPPYAPVSTETSLWLDFADFSLDMVLNESTLEALESASAMYDKEIASLKMELLTLLDQEAALSGE